MAASAYGYGGYPAMKAITIQYLLGAIFLLLGLWALLFPGSVERMAIAPPYYIGNYASAVLIGCFGAQAVLCATLLFSATFTARTFLVFGLIASLPFFVFNYYFVFVVPVFTQWMVLDFVGNLGILACGLAGWRVKRREELAEAQR